MHTWFHVQLDQKNLGRTLLIGPIKVNLEYSFSFAGCSFFGNFLVYFNKPIVSVHKNQSKILLFDWSAIQNRIDSYATQWGKLTFKTDISLDSTYLDSKTFKFISNTFHKTHSSVFCDDVRRSWSGWGSSKATGYCNNSAFAFTDQRSSLFQCLQEAKNIDFYNSSVSIHLNPFKVTKCWPTYSRSTKN